MTDGEINALEPALDKVSLAVLRAVPACGEDEWRRGVGEAASLWQVAEAVDSTDLTDVKLTLNGLEHLGYIACTESLSRKRRVWWRLRKGDEAASESYRKTA